MHIVFWIIWTLAAIYVWAFAVLYFFYTKIKKFELALIDVFCDRSDVFPSLYEVCRWYVARQEEIFAEAMNLRIREFSMRSVSKSLEAFLTLEGELHHEINFIFQVCNKHPKLSKDKHFLYVRDVMIAKSSRISKKMKIYRRIITMYNKSIQIKNYSIIGLLIPFKKRELI